MNMYKNQNQNKVDIVSVGGSFNIKWGKYEFLVGGAIEIRCQT